jgi:hypothetical protein
LAESQYARSVFSALVAVTSNGERVDKNIDNAIKLYADLRTGKPLVAMGNRRPTALEKNLVAIQSLMNEHGEENFENELRREITVKEMNVFLRSKGEKTNNDYLANSRVPAAAIYFGPKLGAFYANLSGSEGYLTMDLWWTRSINRMRGLLIPRATEASIDKFREMMGMPEATREEVVAASIPLRNKYKEYGYTTELEHLAKSKEPDTNAKKPAWTAKAKRVAGSAYPQLEFEHRLEKMANTIHKNEYEMLEEAPFGAGDRRFMYDAAKKAQSILAKDGIKLTLADIQAALWYYEKRLYAKLTGRTADDIGYEEAIIAKSREGTGRERPSVVFSGQPNRRDVGTGESQLPDERGQGDDQKRASLRTAVQSYRQRNEAAPDSHTREGFRDGEGVRVLGRESIAAYTPTEDFKNTVGEFNHKSPTFYEMNPEDADAFKDSIEQSKSNSKYGAAVGVYSEDEYAKMRTFLTQDGKAGFALKGNDIVSVFSSPEHKGSASSSLQLAVQEGGRKLDAFDTILPQIYHENGFKVTGRSRWNEEYVPDNWDKKTFQDFNNGEPDVVFMSYDPEDNTPPDVKSPDQYFENYDDIIKAQDDAVTEYNLRKIGYGTNSQQKSRASLRTAPDTPEFKRFFGDSKIVDADGNPRVMYHGTARDITAFKPKQAGAIFLTDDPAFAERFSKDSIEWMTKHPGEFLTQNQINEGKARAIAAIRKDYKTLPEGKVMIDSIKGGESFTPEAQEYLSKAYKEMMPSGPNIIPAYVRAEKPFDYESKEDINKLKQTNAGKKLDFMDFFAIDIGAWGSIESPKVQGAIKEAGFDSFYVQERGKKNLAVYEPSQIKSATGNEGTYDINNPDIRKSLRTNVKNDINSMPNGAAIWATMNRVTPPRENKGFAERITNALAPEAFSYIRQNFLDRYNRLNDYDKMVAKQMGGIELLADQSAHWASLNSDMAAGVTASALGVGDRMGGTVVLKNGYFTVSTLNGTVKGLVEIISPLARHGDPDIYRSYQIWSAAKRGTRLSREGRFELMTPQEIKDALTLEQKYPEFVDVQKEWIKFNNGIVKMQVDAGIITQAAGQEFMKYSDYLPLYRQMDGENTLGPSIYQSIAGVKAPKTYKGKGTGPIEDYLETIVRNTQAAVQASMKNVAAQKAVKNGMILGMVNKLPAVSSAPNTITILENGKKVSYECADKLWVEAVSSLNLPELPFLSILAKPADLLRTLVTKDPGFMLANMMRDSVSAYITSGADIKPVISTIKNFGDVMMHRSPSYQALLNAGVLGGYEFSRNVEAGAEALAKDLRKKTGTQSGAEKLFKPFTGVWDFLEHGTGASDAATRISVYESTMKETGNEAEAIRRALEVMNFNRKGRSAVVRIAAAAIPFLNARVQGLDVFFRAGIRPFYDKNATAYEKQVQKAMLIRGATLMALSTMYAAAIMGDPDYEKQEQETKDNYWLIPSLGIKLPIPFEVGTLFKTIPERIYRYYYGADTTKDLSDSMSRAIRSTFAFNPVPQVVAPLMEVRDNYSVFTQRPIVSDAMKNIAPEYQVNASTSKFAEFLGKQTGTSPIMLDHIYKGYTGTMGTYLSDVMDAVYSAGSDNPKASQRFEQTPVLKRFLLDPEARGQVSAFYDLKHSVDQTVRTVNLLEKQASPDLGEYISQNISMLGVKKYVSSVDTQMLKLNAQAAMIRSTPMPADEKRKMLDEVAKTQDMLTSSVQLMRKMAQP